jgi:hypothetical protein
MDHRANPQEAGAQTAVQPPFRPDVQPPGAVQPAGPSEAREEVVAVRKNGDGDIVALKLSSGRVVDYKTAQAMAKQGEIAHVQVFRGRDDEEHLRSIPDGRKDNNLDELPSF